MCEGVNNRLTTCTENNWINTDDSWTVLHVNTGIKWITKKKTADPKSRGTKWKTLNKSQTRTSGLHMEVKQARSRKGTDTHYELLLDDTDIDVAGIRGYSGRPLAWTETAQARVLVLQREFPNSQCLSLKKVIVKMPASTQRRWGRQMEIKSDKNNERD